AVKKEAGARDVMISYTHAHAPVAKGVRDFLVEHARMTCWMDTMDPSGIGGGAVWREEIARGIFHAKVVVAVVCDGYSRSEWCLKELAFARLARTPGRSKVHTIRRRLDEMFCVIYCKTLKFILVRHFAN
ncbi:hypothetical protein DYB30_011227, partial [Aphanomyces astaci]